MQMFMYLMLTFPDWQDSVQGSDEFADSLVRGVHSLLDNTVGKF